MRDVFNIDTILQTLDEAVKPCLIPMFNNDKFPFIAGRLLVYRDETTWAIVFNTLTLDSDSAISLVIDPIGPGVKMIAWHDYIKDLPNPLMEKFGNDENVSIFSIFRWMKKDMKGAQSKMEALYQQYQADKAGQASEDDRFIQTAELEWDDDGSEILGISVRGQPVSAAEFSRLKPIYNHDADYSSHELFETLIAGHKDAMLANHDEIARFFPQGLPPLFIALDHWRHPDVVNDEMPSQCETFQLLAKAIHTGQAEDYAPTQEANTDWRRWVDEE